MKTKEIGFETSTHLLNSTFHPICMKATFSISAILALLSTFLKDFVGIEPYAGLAIIILFSIEIFTGIKSSIKEGKPFTSRKLWGGFIKLGIYMTLIGASNLLANYVPAKPFLGFSFNIYEWLHYFFLNFTILQLFTSCIENFRRLGWGEFVPAIDKISTFLKLENTKKDKK